MRTARDAYVSVRRRLRRGKCEWITYSMARGRRWMPRGLRWRVAMTWPFSRVNWCDEPATRVATSRHYDGYDNLPVCEKHLKDVNLSNTVHDMLERGEI